MKVVAVGFWSWWVVANVSRVVVEVVRCRKSFAVVVGVVGCRKSFAVVVEVVVGGRITAVP